MRTTRRIGLAIALVSIFLASHASPGFAQDPDWQKVPRKPKSERTTPKVGYRGAESKAKKFIGLEFGHPRVLSPRVSFPWGDRQRIGGAITMLPDLTAWGVDYRYALNRETIGRLQFLAGIGLTAYNIEDGDRSVSPIGMNVSIGALYPTASRFALGGNLGILQTTGSEGADPVKAYGMRKGLSTAYVSFTLGYFF